MPLTVKKIAKLTMPGRYRDERGLYLQVISPTNRCWLLRFERAGRERWMGLGPVHALGLDEARESARAARKLLASGVDPLDHRARARRQREAEEALTAARNITFEEAARQYFDFHSRKWKNAKHTAQFMSTLRQYAFPHMGKMPVADVDMAMILKAIEPIWYVKPETANRVRGRIETVLNFAKVRGYRSGENPARWRGHLDHALPSRAQVRKAGHHRALPYGEVPTFMAQLKDREGTAARALDFTILTAARTGEVLGAKWDEIDLDKAVWTVPADHMKAGREHRVPLVPVAVALLRVLPREKGNDFVFVGPRKEGLSNMAMDAVLRRMDFKERATVHGFRSSFKDWATEMTSFPPELSEAALAHATGDAVERAYRRGDALEKRRKLMEAWARYCNTPTRAQGDNVEPIRVRA
jgi:integrase